MSRLILFGISILGGTNHQYDKVPKQISVFQSAEYGLENKRSRAGGFTRTCMHFNLESPWQITITEDHTYHVKPRVLDSEINDGYMYLIHVARDDF